MSCLTSFGVGGPAQIVATPKKKEYCALIIEIIKEFNAHYFVIGAGTNILASDSGYDGVIISINGRINNIEFLGDNYWRWDSGVPLASAINICAEKGFGGCEELYKIPGSVGGAITMNASAYGRQMYDIVESIDIVTSDSEFKTLSKAEIKADYRTGGIEKGAIVISTVVKLQPGKREKIFAAMSEFSRMRMKTQPISQRSAGCFFKNPQGMHAGELIDKCGLKGLQIGGAKVSDVHANFIVNFDNATAKDVISLARIIKEKVADKFGVELIPEVVFLGFDEGFKL